MKVPLRWLSEYVDLPTTDIDELSYALDMLGLTVGSVETLETGWTNVYVGRVLDVAAHPDADKVRVCQVDTGSGPEQIICGAWNFNTGAVVAVAKPGATLPGGLEIGQRTIRGVVSNGMICSERELRLGEDHAGILVLDGEPETGAPLEDLVELPDVVFDLEITTNRPDALSIVGVARDVAAYFDVSSRGPVFEMATVAGKTAVTVEIADPEGCRRFTAREIIGVTVGRSPLWLRHRLAKVGVRSISNVVDVTNYVMFELGHPLHAFDADEIRGSHLVVRRASPGETLVTLDEDVRKLSDLDLIIYDADGPTSMSGTMGGARSEVSADTSRVLMEAASWNPPTIMYMSRRHHLISEASTRFERGVDPNLSDLANRRASALVAALSGGEILEGAVDVISTPIEPLVISLTTWDVERVLGPGFGAKHIANLLERLGMDVTGEDPMKVSVPTNRPDITRPIDLVEEVARVHGFDKFEATIPTGPWGGLTVEQRRLRVLQQALTGSGITQAINLPFVSVDDLRKLGRPEGPETLLTVVNPLRDEESRLRPTMLPGLLNAVRYNLSHGAGAVGLFETGKVFFSTPSPGDPRLPDQVDRLAWALVGPIGMSSLGESSRTADGPASLGVWHRLSARLGLADVELLASSAPGYHPGRCAEVRIGGSVIGHVGELSPRSARAYEIQGRVAIAELDLEALLRPGQAPQSQTPSLFPPIDFDLSFLVAVEQPVAGIVAATVEASGGLVEAARVFDEFRSPSLGDGRKAIAIRYRLRSSDHTLTNEEVAPVRAAMIDAANRMGAELRGA